MPPWKNALGEDVFQRYAASQAGAAYGEVLGGGRLVQAGGRAVLAIGGVGRLPTLVADLCVLPGPRLQVFGILTKRSLLLV